MIPKKLVPPDAVRVWRGFRSPALSQPDFMDKLSTVFVPATVEMQTQIGLDAYLPTIPGGLSGKPETVPDETAILYWNSQETYHNGFKTLAVRTYTLTHGAVYTSESRADFPLFFEGTMDQDQPYYLFQNSADWMLSPAHHLVAGIPDGTTPEDFRTAVTNVAKEIQGEKGLQGAVICVGADYIVYWELGQDGSTEPSEGFNELVKLTGWNLVAAPNPTAPPVGLWDNWPGMLIKPGDSFNMQFGRGV